MLANTLFGLPSTDRSATRLKIHPRYLDSEFSESPLLVSSAAFLLLFENNPHPMWIYDAKKLRFLSVNDAAIRNYIYSREEFAAMTIDQLHLQEEVRALKEHLEGTPCKPKAPRTWHHRRKDGTILEAEITTCGMMFNGRKAQLVLATDVTGRERAREALRETQERYRDLFDHSNDVMFTTDLQGKVTSLNKAGESLTGYSLEEIIRTDAAQILGPKSLELSRSIRSDYLFQ